MIEKNIINADVAKIDLEDVTFQISARSAEGQLFQSIKKIGLTQLPVLQRMGNDTFRVVCGFCRLNVIKKLGLPAINAFVVDDRVAEQDLFEFALLDNLASRQFAAMEVCFILNKLTDVFNVQEKEIIQKWLPLLGYGRNPRILELYLPLAGLTDEWQQAVNQSTIGIDFAAKIAKLDDSDSQAFFHLFSTLHMGKNRQKEFLDLLVDVAAIEKTTISALLASDIFQSLLADEKRTHSQKADRLKMILWEKRYPRYMDVRNQFDALIKSAKLPPDLSISASPFFQSEDFSVMFTFQNKEDFITHLEHLQRCLETSIIDQVTQLT